MHDEYWAGKGIFCVDEREVATCSLFLAFPHVFLYFLLSLNVPCCGAEAGLIHGGGLSVVGWFITYTPNAYHVQNRQTSILTCPLRLPTLLVR